MTAYPILILTLLVVIIWAVFHFFRRKTKKTDKLKEEYYRISNLPRDASKRSLDTQIERLKQKNPGREPEWYLEKIIFDLKRDRL